MKKIKQAENYKKMIYNRAYGWYLKTGIPIDDFVAEGWYGYVKAIKNHDKNRPFKPYLATILYNTMKNYADKQRKTIISPDIGIDTPCFIDPLVELVFKDSIRKLSQEAKEVVEVALNTPSEILEMVKKTNRACNKTMILRYFCKYKKWTYQKTREAFEEIAEIWR